MDAIRGFVYRTIYENTQRTYCVFVLKDYNEEYITCTGKFESPKEGEDIEVRGRYVEHEKYGRQFDATSVEKLKPDNMGAAKTYLLNLGIKGFGEKSVEKVLEYFGKAPYGWKDYDIAGIVLTLFKNQTLRFEFGGRNVEVSDVSVVDYVTKRDAIDRLIIKIRIKISQSLINNAKELARELWGFTAMPNDEDGIMASFKNKAENELYKAKDSTGQKDVSLSALLAFYDDHRYPGKRILENGIKLLKSIIEINDVKVFFNTLQDLREDLLDYEEDVQDVKKFFANQRTIFDNAMKELDIFEANRSYVLDQKTLDIVFELDRITHLQSPYSQIHLLPDLVRQFVSCFAALLQTECEPVMMDIKQDLAITIGYAEENGLTKDFGEKIQTSFANLLDRLERVNNIYEGIAMRTESDRLKQRLIEQMQAERYNSLVKEEQGNYSVEVPVRKMKTISMRSLFSGSTQITNEADIEHLAAEVTRKLKEALDENTTIRIV